MCALRIPDASAGPASCFGTPRSYPCAATFSANSFRLIQFRKNVSVTPFVSHTFKTKDLKPFRFIHFQKKVGVGAPSSYNSSARRHSPLSADASAPMNSTLKSILDLYDPSAPLAQASTIPAPCYVDARVAELQRQARLGRASPAAG